MLTARLDYYKIKFGIEKKNLIKNRICFKIIKFRMTSVFESHLQMGS